LCQFQQIGLEFSQISLNPLAVVFNCFSKAELGATDRFSEATWELQMAFLKPPEECTQISRRL
jgi:hypothetical protein